MSRKLRKNAFPGAPNRARTVRPGPSPLLHSSHLARGPVNGIVESSQLAAGFEDMLAPIARGLSVSPFSHLRPLDICTLLLTGLMRDGMWYIEKGKIQYPVRNFRFNQSILALPAPGNVDLIGAPERVSNREFQGSNSALLPALKAKEFHFTSQSEAV